MNQNWFFNLEQFEPKPELELQILARIQQQLNRQLRFQVWTARLTTVLSALIIIPAFIFMIQDVLASEFYQYMVLLVADTAVVLNFWRELGLALIESLPMLSVTVFLVSAVCLLGSIRWLNKNMRNYSLNII